MTVRSAAPVLAVQDVDASMRFYVDFLGFHADPFPDTPPHAFCILTGDGAELMLQLRDGAPTREDRRCHVYVRVTDVRSLAERIAERGIDVVQQLTKRPYGDTEIAIRDSDGYVMVLSELER
jgi:predicted enzyme related to lactoylglutathione lyase